MVTIHAWNEEALESRVLNMEIVFRRRREAKSLLGRMCSDKFSGDGEFRKERSRNASVMEILPEKDI